ncbi:MAG: TonB-dependent receptor plug domain-containing protein [Tannerellaceae bacterium]|nr:TonB-dependent receptor plug domain-containing protein [Tannerellaceae bacterium]
MKRLFYWFCLCCAGCCAAAYGQTEPLNVQPEEGATIYRLFEVIEEQTSFRVYYLPSGELDSIRVSPTLAAGPPPAVLQSVFTGTAFRVSQYGRGLFVSTQPALMTSLPEGYFNVQGAIRQGEGEAGRQTAPVFATQRRTSGEDEPERSYNLPEVLISSERSDAVRNVTAGLQRLQVNTVRKIPTAFGEADILRAVMSLPGVKTVGEASGGFNVRGGATDQNLILFNEGTVYNPTHLFGFFSTFNSGVVRDMELYKSSVPARYGGRISSVLNITTREGDKKKTQGSASLNLLTSSLTLEGPIVKDKTSYIIGGRTTYSDWILRQLPRNSGYRDGSAGFYDMNLMVSHVFDLNNALYLSGYISRDRFAFDSDNRYFYRNANASLRWRHIYNNSLSSLVAAGYDHYDYDTESTENPVNAYILSFAIDQYYARAGFNYNPGAGHTMDFGFNGVLYSLNPGTYRPSGSESLVVSRSVSTEKALEPALYISDQWEVTPELGVDLGVRYSMFNVMGPRTYNLYPGDALPSLGAADGTATEGSGVFKTYHGLELRASARYEFVPGASVKAAYNTMRQNIHKLSNTTVMSPTDTWKLSDAYIKPQTGSQTSLGFYKSFGGNAIETSLEAYYKQADNYLDYRTGAQLLMNDHIETDVLATRMRAYGIEFMVKKAEGRLNGWVSYTYSRAQLRQDDPRIASPVNNGDWYAADYDKPHEVKMVANYKFTHRYSLSVNCDYSTGRPVSLPASKFNYAGGEFVYYSGRNKYRIPDFFRIDLAFNIEPSHHLTLLTHSTVVFGVYNLTGRKNAYSVYYIAEEGALKGYRLAIFGMPVPYVSYNIKF